MLNKTSFTFIAPRASISPDPADKEKLRVNVSQMSLEECLALSAITSKAALRLQSDAVNKRDQGMAANHALNYKPSQPERSKDAS